MDNQSYKDIYLNDELLTSLKLIEIGFGELQKLNLANDFYHLPFQLLSSGFERLMKCHICFGYLEKNKTYPNSEYLKECGGKNGHDLIELKKHILELYFSSRVIALQEDFRFLSSNKNLNELLYLLSEFGKHSRYYNLDVITSAKKPSKDIKSRWEKYESSILTASPKMLKMYKNINLQNKVYDLIKQETIITMEKFVRGITRQFTIGRLGQKANQYSYIFFSFITLRDDKLGLKDYSNIKN